jgi:hypothetical protein
MLGSLSRHLTQVTPFGHKQRSVAGSVKDPSSAVGEQNEQNEDSRASIKDKSKLLLGRFHIGYSRN